MICRSFNFWRLPLVESVGHLEDKVGWFEAFGMPMAEVLSSWLPFQWDME